jgi:DNA-binding XRE family transcriptional regulator
MPFDTAKIRARRAKLKLTQAAAAERAGLVREAWNRIERLKRDDITLTTAERVARALECRIDSLLADLPAEPTK